MGPIRIVIHSILLSVNCAGLHCSAAMLRNKGGTLPHGPLPFGVRVSKLTILFSEPSPDTMAWLSHSNHYKEAWGIRHSTKIGRAFKESTFTATRRQTGM
ncbi:hypothetical protein P879_11093 [Paragonimus westermani]|uniref:Secreted protein n=1 Tax=Paragonimus westermani TaxID=34504 RepID=A0A8T0D645_9TREM|nr:hypothetical protein P879_11093 [Paragonimus westermani]